MVEEDGLNTPDISTGEIFFPCACPRQRLRRCRHTETSFLFVIVGNTWTKYRREKRFGEAVGNAFIFRILQLTWSIDFCSFFIAKHFCVLRIPLWENMFPVLFRLFRGSVLDVSLHGVNNHLAYLVFVIAYILPPDALERLFNGLDRLGHQIFNFRQDHVFLPGRKTCTCDFGCSQ